MPNTVKVGTQVTGVAQSSSELDKLRDKFGKLQSQGAKGFAIGASAAVTAKGLDIVGSALGGIVSAAEGAIQKASDLNETLSKSHVVFGTSAKDVEAFGKTAAKSFGLSENAAIAAAASIGNLLLSTGTAPEKVAPMSIAIVKLASDLASFNNIPIDEALAKLQSGLVGQERPLRELGVAISAASVDTEAAALGFHKLNGVFSEGEKVQARYSLIFKQTKTAQGDFARTADGLANSQRIANAELEDGQAIIGQKLLPVQLKLTQAVIEVLPYIAGLADGLGNVFTAAGKLSEGIDALNGKLPETRAKTVDLGKALFDIGVNLGPLGGVVQRQVDEQIDGLHKLAVAADETDAQVKRSTQAFAASIGVDARDMRKSITGVATATEDAAARVQAAYRKMAKSALESATDQVHNYYDVIITQDKLAATNAELSAARKIVAGGKAKAADIANLHQLEADQAELEATLAEHGATTSKIFKKTMAGLYKDLEHAHGAEATAILAEIRRLQLLDAAAAISNGKMLTLGQTITATLAKGGYISAGGAGAGLPKHKAAGGPVMPGRDYIVGEEGEEKLTMYPDGGGFVTPGAKRSKALPSAPSGGSFGVSAGVIGGTVNHFNFYGVGVLTPGSAEAIGRVIEPIVTKAQQRQGLLPRAAGR